MTKFRKLVDILTKWMDYMLCRVRLDKDVPTLELIPVPETCNTICHFSKLEISIDSDHLEDTFIRIDDDRYFMCHDTWNVVRVGAYKYILSKGNDIVELDVLPEFSQVHGIINRLIKF